MEPDNPPEEPLAPPPLPPRHQRRLALGVFGVAAVALALPIVIGSLQGDPPPRQAALRAVDSETRYDTVADGRYPDGTGWRVVAFENLDALSCLTTALRPPGRDWPRLDTVDDEAAGGCVRGGALSVYENGEGRRRLVAGSVDARLTRVVLDRCDGGTVRVRPAPSPATNRAYFAFPDAGDRVRSVTGLAGGERIIRVSVDRCPAAD